MANVFTIIVTYNGSRWIQSCMDHLLKSDHPSNIVVVGNHSTDDTIVLLQKNYQSTAYTLIQSGENLGFGRGNNIGIKYALDAGADYIFLLNQDAYVEPGCIGQLISSLQQHKAYGILSPLQLDSSGGQLDSAFKRYMLASLNDNEIKKIVTERTCRVVPARFINAAAWMIPVAALRKTGLFHPVFAHYGEDNHYCSRMQYHGFKTGIDCGAAVIHDRGNDTGDRQKHLLRQLRTVPLYTLLDIRKPFLLAWFLGFNKLRQLKKKLGSHPSPETQQLYEQQQKWFRENLGRARQIREETKKDAGI